MKLGKKNFYIAPWYGVAQKERQYTLAQHYFVKIGKKNYILHFGSALIGCETWKEKHYITTWYSITSITS